jgi:hypothetical protein
LLDHVSDSIGVLAEARVIAGAGARAAPPGLAAVLLPIAPLLITMGTRLGMFADPVRLPGRAWPGDQLVAFLGRQQRLSQAPNSGRPESFKSPRSRPRRFQGIRLVCISRPPDKRRGIRKNTAELEEQT